MGFYTKDGWIDIEWIFNHAQKMHEHFIFLSGGRGIGKTFSVLDFIYNKCKLEKSRFIYLRRTPTELELCGTEDYSPFLTLNKQRNYNITVERKNKAYRIKDGENNIGNMLCCLDSDKAKGIGADTVNYIVYDEFSRSQNSRRTIKDEADAFLNLYETINRNRELEGKPPVIVFFLTNSVNSECDLYLTLGLCIRISKIKKKGIFPAMFDDSERDLLFIDFGAEGPISKKKRETALYRLTNGTGFAEMALDNIYDNEYHVNIESKNIKEYRPLVFVGELAIYQHKSKPEFYCTDHKAGTFKQIFGSTSQELDLFRARYNTVWYSYSLGAVYFENVACESLFKRYFNNR